MNIPLLKEIKSHILTNPTSLDMDTYHNHCGTVACIAGWALIKKLGKETVLKTRRELYNRVLNASFVNQDLEYYSWPLDEAAKLFNITDNQAMALFLTDNWPNDFRDEYENNGNYNTPEERASITARRIDHFIKTGE